MFNVDLAGLIAMKARIQTVIDEMPAYCSEAVRLVGEETLIQLYDNCPYDGEEDNGQIPGEAGHLRDSFYVLDNRAMAIDSSSTVMTEEPIKLSYVTGGTDSPIVPLTAQALWWPGAGHPVASVNGQSGNDFITPVADEIANDVAPIIQDVTDAIIAALEG